jgi:hypothetical protein
MRISSGDVVGSIWYTERKTREKFTVSQGVKYVHEIAWVKGVIEAESLRAV